MAENFAWVIVYSLNCDEPQHDRKAFAKARCADPDADEFEFHNEGTATQARAYARRDGWTIRRDGTATCPMCNAKRRERRTPPPQTRGA